MSLFFSLFSLFFSLFLLSFFSLFSLFPLSSLFLLFSLSPHSHSLSQTIWRRLPLPDRAEAQFNMTSFALSLNEIEPGTEKILPPTDCRRRTDQRLYEDGKLDEAQAEKERLEDAQRSARRIREARGEAYKPLFFTHSVDPDLKVGGWHYSGNYWERREKRDWKGMPDIYGVQK